MKRIIVLVVSMTLLLSAPFAMAHGGASYRANIDRIAKRNQAYQQRIDKKLAKIEKEAARDLSRMSGTSR